MATVITWTKEYSSSDDGSILYGADLENIQSAIEGHSHTYTSLTVTNLSVTNAIFPATQVPSANANTLDDYEEGDWTAAFVCGTSGTITINTDFKTGAYVKIGRMVTVTGEFLVTSVSSPVGILTLTGLPFTCGTARKFSAGVAVAADTLETSGTTTIMGMVVINTTTIRLARFTAGAQAAMAGDVKANSVFYISATYFTD